MVLPPNIYAKTFPGKLSSGSIGFTDRFSTFDYLLIWDFQCFFNPFGLFSLGVSPMGALPMGNNLLLPLGGARFCQACPCGHKCD